MTTSRDQEGYDDATTFTQRGRPSADSRTYRMPPSIISAWRGFSHVHVLSPLFRAWRLAGVTARNSRS